MRWIEHGERTLYDSNWMSLRLVDIEVPGGERFDHHVLRLPTHAAGTVIFDAEREAVLLLWRHRFITDAWGWEVPAGKVDPGEDAASAAAREVIEETGWSPGPLTHLCTYAPVSGVGDHRFELYAGAGAMYVGEPTDPAEAERIEWVPVAKLREEIRAGRVDNGLSLTALLWCLVEGIIA